MKWILLLFTHFCGQAFALEASDVFTFADSFTCNDRFPHHSYCEAVEFKSWRPEERELVSEYLKAMRGPRFEKLLAVIKDKGITKFHRVSYASSWSANHALRRVQFTRRHDKVLLWVNSVTRMVGFTDAFFKGTKFIDPRAALPRKQLNVIHEIMHIFDLAADDPSQSAAFQKAIGWKWDGHNHIVETIPFARATEQFKEIMVYLDNGNAARTYELDRELGVSYGVPTLYSLSNIRESFAETLTYALLDPTAGEYLSTETLDYVDKLLK